LLTNLSARSQPFWNFAHRLTFRFRISLWPDAFWFGPNGKCSDIPQSEGRGGCRGASMKGIVPLFLGIFGTFAFSWVGLILIPNLQIGHLDPQMDEEGTDVYPAPKSGMADRGRKIYAANGCIYCHSQQVRADYAASDIDRKWGERRSAPRDYIFARPVLLGKMRMGPDLSNIGKRAPVEEENPSPGPSASPAGSPAAAALPGKAASAASPAPSASSPAPAASPPPKPANSPAASASPVASPAPPPS